MRRAVMNDENRCSSVKEPIGRITRARAKTLGSSSAGLPPLHPCTKKNDKPRANLKRAAPDSNNDAASCPQPKKRAVLKDVTNVTSENLNIICIDASKVQPMKQDRKDVPIQTKANAAPACFVGKSEFPGDERGDMIEETNIKVQESREICSAENLAILPNEIICTNVSAAAESHNFYQKEESLEERGITDIDLEHRDPKMCSVYAADIYSSLHAVQLNRRPLSDYMEKLQKDITQGMRSILIDWLVEVSEEYRLVPDTLYLTVNLIDRFLSENYVDKKRLQLLGVTCMLIASKYEEICPPRVEEFCFITDNTYTKEEVVKMESHVLNLLDFHLSVPTTKKFLRRFIQAAQVSYAVPSVELEFLANYLAELTLIEYSFLKFLPSLIAASAVFLARWTLDQSEHPWNQTLEHYTRYKTFELKNTVLELHDLQLNTSMSMLNAIRIKYRQSKFRSVSNLHSPKPVQSLFKP